MTAEAKRMISIAVDLMLLAAVLLLVVLLASQGRDSVNAFSEQQGLRPKFVSGIQHTRGLLSYYEMTDIIDFYAPMLPVHVEYDKNNTRYRLTFSTSSASGVANDGIVRMIVKELCSDENCSLCMALHDCSLECCAKCTEAHHAGARTAFAYTGNPDDCKRCLPWHFENCPTGCVSSAPRAVEYRRVSGAFYRNESPLSMDSGYLTLALDMGFIGAGCDVVGHPKDCSECRLEAYKFLPLKNIPGNGMLGYEFTRALFEWTLYRSGTSEPTFLCTVLQKYDKTQIDSIILRLQ